MQDRLFKQDSQKIGCCISNSLGALCGHSQAPSIQPKRYNCNGPPIRGPRRVLAMNGRAQSQESHIKYLARAQVRSLNGGMKTTPKTRPSNVTSFILEGRWPLAGFDQRQLRRLSKTAKRNGMRVSISSLKLSSHSSRNASLREVRYPIPPDTATPSHVRADSWRHSLQNRGCCLNRKEMAIE